MLVLSNDDVEQLLGMRDCIRALEPMYCDYAAGKALLSPRVDNMAPTRLDGAYYTFKHMGGTWPAKSVQALRVNSDVITHPFVAGKQRRVTQPLADGRWVGLVLLFSTETGALLAMFPDGVMQRHRVGAANGIAMKQRIGNSIPAQSRFAEPARREQVWKKSPTAHDGSQVHACVFLAGRRPQSERVLSGMIGQLPRNLFQARNTAHPSQLTLLQAPDRVGRGATPAVLPHRRTCGSAYGGSCLLGVRPQRASFRASCRLSANRRRQPPSGIPVPPV